MVGGLLFSSVCVGDFFFFFFKQRAAYGMRIRDGSSDVCSSDLWHLAVIPEPAPRQIRTVWSLRHARFIDDLARSSRARKIEGSTCLKRSNRKSSSVDRKSGGVGKSGSVRVNLGGRRILKKKKTMNNKITTRYKTKKNKRK